MKISFANRHTILGLLKNKGGAKAKNTVFPIEMALVARDAYAFTWDSAVSRLSVRDGSTFVSSGVKWGIDARSNGTPASIHIHPTQGGGKAVNIDREIPPLRAYVTLLENGRTKQEALNKAVEICKKTDGDVNKMHAVIIALNKMEEV